MMLYYCKTICRPEHFLKQEFVPKLLSVLREGYTRKAFLSDATAGVIVGVVALPLAIAFAIASGVKPEQGLFTAVVAGLVVAALGGSRVQIAGPTGAFIVIVYGIVQKYGLDGLMVATLMSGVLLVIMGFARLGTLLRFVPYPLTVGFTSGIALIIFSSQIKDILGLPIKDLSPDFVEKWWQYGENISQADLSSVMVGAGSLLIITLWPKITKRIPGTLIAILVMTAVVQLFKLPVATIGSRFGAVPDMLPAPHVPQIGWREITGLVGPAFTIAILGAIESLLSAVVADGMLRTRHRSNMELVAQGAANILAPLFGGIPATGAIARTATNIKNGGRSPVAGIVHSITLLLIMLFFGRWAKLIPMPVLAAILIVVSYNMSEWRQFKKTLRSPRSDVAVMLVTFFLTVMFDLTVAIQIGIILSSLLFMKRMADVSEVNAVTRDLRDEGLDPNVGPSSRPLPAGVEVFQVLGTLFFGAVREFTEALRQVETRPRVVILETRNLLAIDATGLRTLEQLTQDFEERGTVLVISGIHKQPLVAIAQSGLLDRLGEDNICGSLDDAIARAEIIISGQTPDNK
jgi:SulP family sulfate permease